MARHELSVTDYSVQVESDGGYSGFQELPTHTYVIGNGHGPEAEVIIDEIGLVRGEESFSRVSTRLLGAGTLNTLRLKSEHFITPPLSEPGAREEAALAAAEAIAANGHRTETAEEHL